ncbi:hypothetical protein CVT25_002407 [Psilocybe cyanescens]|uniref:Uncharacterized protein n=1 Tax=Psilocybe cyanescens TaxID=93625 RepID=A0A409WKE0_PSICY|nr:hypothetical protein CVT25_002407 [Psilocybe cyanescens]
MPQMTSGATRATEIAGTRNDTQSRDPIQSESESESESSESESESTPTTIRKIGESSETNQKQAPNDDYSSESESGSESEQPATGPSNYSSVHFFMRALQRKLEEKAKSEMLAAGLRDALEREKLNKLHPQSSGPRSSPASQPRKRIKVEETSSPDNLLRELSIPEFYSRHFYDVHTFLLKRNYGNPVVLASLKESGFTKYELRSMEGLDLPVLITRFTSLLSDDCRKPAQLESLAFAVFSASSAEWAMLNDASIYVQ